MCVDISGMEVDLDPADGWTQALLYLGECQSRLVRNNRDAGVSGTTFQVTPNALSALNLGTGTNSTSSFTVIGFRAVQY